MDSLMHADRRLTLPGHGAYLEALAALQDSNIALVNGYSNHAPMVVEALAHLGADGAVSRWMSRTQATRQQRARAGDRSADNPLARFEVVRADVLADMQHRPWRDVLGEHAARLAPGHASAAVHGVIRVGHAVRGLALQDHPVTRAELASALAYWSQVYNEQAFGPVDGVAVENAGKGEKAGKGENAGKREKAGLAQRTPQEAWQSLGLVPAHLRKDSGAITAAMRLAYTAPGFAQVSDALVWPDDPVAATRLVAELVLDMFLAGARDGRTALILTHALTGLMAAWNIGTETDAELHHRLVREAFRSAAAMHVAFSPLQGESAMAAQAAQSAQAAPPSARQLIASAIASGDDHVIKLTDACLDLEAITGCSRFRFAAARGAELMG